MSPLAPLRKWTLSAGIAIALVLTLPLVGLPLAHADLGDAPSSKSSSDGMGQVEDSDKPKDPSLLDKKPADAAVAQQQQAPVGPPFYEKWQFWVIAVAVVVGVGALILGRHGARAHHQRGRRQAVQRGLPGTLLRGGPLMRAIRRLPTLAMLALLAAAGCSEYHYYDIDVTFNTAPGQFMGTNEVSTIQRCVLTVSGADSATSPAYRLENGCPPMTPAGIGTHMGITEFATFEDSGQLTFTIVGLRRHHARRCLQDRAGREDGRGDLGEHHHGDDHRGQDLRRLRAVPIAALSRFARERLEHISKIAALSRFARERLEHISKIAALSRFARERLVDRIVDLDRVAELAFQVLA